ncbi:MAG TPA: thioredoxin family protein [Cryomorphaceae bacterium]|nr:thioredoxin family protein [Cryomorphaceae bacterium]
MDNSLISYPENALTYQDYVRQVSEMVNHKSTSGPNQAESLVNYTHLNFRRMTRLNKTIVMDEKLVRLVEAHPNKMVWVIITEAWCGDAAQNIPFLAKLAEKASNVELRLVYRDENLDFMDVYLTNGSRSIPKLIAFDQATGNQLFSWGPRPAPVQKMVIEYKELLDHEKLPFDKFAELMHSWYAKDKNETLKNELLHIFRTPD